MKREASGRLDWLVELDPGYIECAVDNQVIDKRDKQGRALEIHYEDDVEQADYRYQLQCPKCLGKSFFCFYGNYKTINQCTNCSLAIAYDG